MSWSEQLPEDGSEKKVPVDFSIGGFEGVDDLLAKKFLNSHEIKESWKQELFTWFRWIAQSVMLNNIKKFISEYPHDIKELEDFDSKYNWEINDKWELLDINGNSIQLTPIQLARDTKFWVHSLTHHVDEFLLPWIEAWIYQDTSFTEILPESISSLLKSWKRKILSSITLERLKINFNSQENAFYKDYNGLVSENWNLLRNNWEEGNLPWNYDTYSLCHKIDEQRLQHELEWYMTTFFSSTYTFN